MGLSAQHGFAVRALSGALMSVLGAFVCSPVLAQSNNADAMLQTGAPTLKIDDARRYFVRFGYVAMKPNTKSGEVHDVSGPVVTRETLGQYGQSIWQRFLAGDPTADLGEALQAGAISGVSFVDGSPVNSGMRQDGLTALGIPGGIRVDAKSAGTPAVSLGYFLDEDQQWAVEGFVLAVPLKNEVYASQKVNGLDFNTKQQVVRSGGLDGKKVMSTQVLPPLLMLSKYFGDKNSKWRPSVGIGGVYAIFFDSKVPDYVSDYAGGKTSVTLKNGFGAGVFAGLQYRVDSRWHLNATVGYLKLKTTGTMTTENTRLSGDSVALADYGGNTSDAIAVVQTNNKPLLNKILFNLANYKNGGTDGSYGTFVRKIEARLDPYIFWLSAGYSF